MPHSQIIIVVIKDICTRNQLQGLVVLQYNKLDVSYHTARHAKGHQVTQGSCITQCVHITLQYIPQGTSI